MTYAGMGAPEPRFDWLLSHPSKLPNQTWATVFERAGYHEDDGHMCKMIRVMKHAENVSKPYDHLPEFKVKQKMFLRAAIAAIDSGSKQPMEWTKHFDFIRGAGYPEAWEKVPLRSARVVEQPITPVTNSHGPTLTNGTSSNVKEEPVINNTFSGTGKLNGRPFVNGTSPFVGNVMKSPDKAIPMPEKQAQLLHATAQISAGAS